ncbi:LPS translocon maturation chaperone LptM [Elongatibacter sediminis]|uniref:Lipoprotein n=1 Tax=Elongatibacter sediminis TaxID=3119006 RepID=A0AAW9R616_9GAMM
MSGPFRPAARAVTLTVLLALISIPALTACGQRGPLYLPGDGTPARPVSRPERTPPPLESESESGSDESMPQAGESHADEVFTDDFATEDDDG